MPAQSNAMLSTQTIAALNGMTPDAWLKKANEKGWLYQPGKDQVPTVQGEKAGIQLRDSPFGADLYWSPDIRVH